MPINFTCPHCGDTTDVSDQKVGQSGPCAACGETVTARRRYPGWLVVLFVGVLMVVAFWVVVALPARRAARRSNCMDHMKQISLGLQNYRAANGSFPPAYTVDENGNRLHSWRTLILPYYEEGELYSKIDLDQPWDAPANRFLAETSIPGYSCPSDQSNPNETNYVMIVGPDTMSPGIRGRKIEEFSDRTSRTIMLVEVTGSGIHWAEPRDLNADEITFGINDGTGGISSAHVGVACFLLADGSVHLFDDTTDSEVVRQFTTVAGGESVEIPPHRYQD